jgi:hypothetical protein
VHGAQLTVGAGVDVYAELERKAIRAVHGRRDGPKAQEEVLVTLVEGLVGRADGDSCVVRESLCDGIDRHVPDAHAVVEGLNAGDDGEVVLVPGLRRRLVLA